MNSYSVTLKGEKATLYWKDGKIAADGYDLKNEKMALALMGGLGEGIGVLLVAIDEYCAEEVDLKNLLVSLEHDILRIEADYNGFVTDEDEGAGEMFYQYISYSPSADYRWNAAIKGNFSEKGFKRMSRDPSANVVICLLETQHVQPMYHQELANHSQANVRYALLARATLSREILGKLQYDDNRDVRKLIPAQRGVTGEILKHLANDEDEYVQEAVFTSKEMSQELALHFAKLGTPLQKLLLALNSTHMAVWNYLRINGSRREVEALDMNKAANKFWRNNAGRVRTPSEETYEIP